MFFRYVSLTYHCKATQRFRQCQVVVDQLPKIDDKSEKSLGGLPRRYVVILPVGLCSSFLHQSIGRTGTGWWLPVCALPFRCGALLQECRRLFLPFS